MKELWQNKSRLIGKLLINQFAFSLFGVFVSSALTRSGVLSVLAGLFSLLFYLSVVGFAVLDDGQRDKIAFEAGRVDGRSPVTGLGYACLSFVPTILLCLVHVLLYVGGIADTVRSILNLIIRFFLAGEVLGIDAGLGGFRYDPVIAARVSDAPQALQFMSNADLFFLLFALAAPLILGFVYALAFTGKITYNTSENKGKKRR